MFFEGSENYTCEGKKMSFLARQNASPQSTQILELQNDKIFGIYV